MRTGVQWRPWRNGSGSWKTVYERLRLWSGDGTWELLLRQVQAAADVAGEIDMGHVGGLHHGRRRSRGRLRGSGEAAGGQDGVLAIVGAREVDGEAPGTGGSALAQTHLLAVIQPRCLAADEQPSRSGFLVSEPGRSSARCLQSGSECRPERTSGGR
ncbi:transposase [Streptomyces agglomeratus]|uniref:transposase n=1 Tax=Streptomyces agglomeratus TaxID=285458 RepID=UPI000D1B3816